jgi:hypothetical protein
MQAAVSGSLRMAACCDADLWFILRLESPLDPIPCGPDIAGRLLNAGSDLLVFLDNTNWDEVRGHLEVESAAVQALDLFLFLLDRDLPRSLRADALNDLLPILPHTQERLASVLFGTPLSGSADAQGALRICDEPSAAHAKALLTDLLVAQPFVREVVEAWDLIPRTAFAAEVSYEQTRSIFTHRGLFKGLARSAARIGGVDEFLATAVACFPEHRAVLQAWVHALQHRHPLLPASAVEQAPSNESSELLTSGPAEPTREGLQFIAAKIRTTHTTPARSECPAVADHQLLSRIGGGSYGEVWLGRSVMGEYRAIKIVYRNSFADERPFLRELSGLRNFEPISRSYEGFLDVVQIGMNEGQGYFYYVMELGDDVGSGRAVDPAQYHPKTLSVEIARRGKLPVQECLQLGITLSQAIAELHKHGFVHRDVKPSNIIFVNGIPKLADIGLVTEVTEGGTYVGTQGFIPPEGPGTAQADVYSLGKVLYEAATGKDRLEFPELPTFTEEADDRELFLELNEVILHACSADPSRRYETASDMHADLVVAMNGKSIRRLRLLEHRLSNLKRVGGISVLICGTVAGLFYLTYEMAVSGLQPIRVQLQIGWVTLAVGAITFAAGIWIRALYEARWVARYSSRLQGTDPGAGVGNWWRKSIKRFIETRPRADRLESKPQVRDQPALANVSEVTMLAARVSPTGFFDTKAFACSELRTAASLPPETLKRQFQYHVDHIEEQYESLKRGVKMAYTFWFGCVALCVMALATAFAAMLTGHFTQAIGASLLLIPMYPLLRIIDQREDRYRQLATKKTEHIEYAKSWLTAMEFVESIEDAELKARQEKRLVQVFQKQMSSARVPLDTYS